MSDVRFERPVRRYLAWATQGAVAVFAGIGGWRFGLEAGGVLIGLIAVLNCAAFAALLAGSAIQWLSKALGSIGGKG